MLILTRRVGANDTERERVIAVGELDEPDSAPSVIH